MGRLQKKGKSGAATNFITRNQALKKLQVTLADFRRLCILKGIFPREPRNKKKANKGSTAPATFYYSKDVAFLAHEPVLQKLREHKIFAKKLSKALGKGEYSDAKRIESNKPVYTLDHLVKERYPTFTDALRDLDDALCMIFLFAIMPSSDRISNKVVENCTRLGAEFQRYVIHSKSLRKVFLSIKGIYYQAEIKGQTITWIVPYKFTQHVPSDVDFRVMLTFLEFYQTLLGFVNFRLYTELNLIYPPKFDMKKDEQAGELMAFDLETNVNGDVAAQEPALNGGQIDKDAAKRIESLSKKLDEIEEEDDLEDTDVAEQVTAAEADEFTEATPSKATNAEDTTTAAPLVTLHDLQAAAENVGQLQSLFSKFTFFLSREVTRQSLEFVLGSFSGKVGWDPVLGAGSPFTEDDQRITHQLCDRPTVTRTYPNRIYVQPQWAYDCVNAGKLLKTDAYAPGETLPPHLSPFVQYSERDYVPGEDVEEAEEEMDVEVEPEEEDVDQAELAAEAAGTTFSDYKDPKVAKSKKPKKASKAKTEEEEAKDMAKMMMTNKKKKLYDAMQISNKRKDDAASKLKSKKVKLAKK